MSDAITKKTYGLFDNAFNAKLISELKSNNEELLLFPAIKTKKAEVSAENIETIKNLAEFDWIIFTDVFAADYFIEILNENEVEFFDLDNLTVCTLGEAVADRLRFIQVHADVIPSKINDETVFKTISQYIGGEFEGLRFLVVENSDSKHSIAVKLRSEKALVEEFYIYEDFVQDETISSKLRALVLGGAIDEMIFSQPEDILSFRSIIQKIDVSTVLSETKVSATSEIVYQSLQENNLKPLYFHYK